jgi:hypothetical protein
LIGSTEKLGTGVNVQDRLIAEHHLDAPWRPSDVEQRTGRTRRQGNKYSRVWSFRYVTEGNNSQAGFDAFLWQTLETKAKFIAQVSNGNVKSRTAEDVDEAVLSFAQVKAMASGNPIIMEKAKLDAEYNSLKIQAKGHEQKQSQIYFNGNQLRAKLVTIPEIIDNIHRDLEGIDPDAPIFINDEEVTEIPLINKALRKLVKAESVVERLSVTVGKFIIKAIGFFDTKLAVCGLNSYQMAHASYESLRYMLSHGIKDAISYQEAKLEQAQIDLIAIEQQVNKPFEHLDKMISMKARIKEIEALLQEVKEDDSIKSFATWSVCADYISPEAEIIDELINRQDRPDWVNQITAVIPEVSNVIEFPIQKIMDKPHIVQTEFKFETVKCKTGMTSNDLQGCLF